MNWNRVLRRQKRKESFQENELYISIHKAIFEADDSWTGHQSFGYHSGTADPWALAYMVDEIIPLKSVKMILLWGCVMFLFAFLAWIGNIGANRMASKVARNTTERLRLDLYTKISYLSSRQAEAFTMPSLISRATTDTYNIHQMVGMMQRLGVRAPIMMLGGIGITMTLDVQLTLIMVCMLPFMGIFVYKISRKGIPLYTYVQEAIDRFVRQLREDITGVRVIKALSKVEYETQKFDQINEEVVNRDRHAGMIMNILNPVMNFLLNVGMVLVILLGAWRVNQGLTQPGTIIAFMSYVTLILNAMLFMSRLFVMTSKATASGKRIEAVLDTPQDLLLEEHAPLDTEDHIVFDHVTYSYEGAAPNVKDITFSLKKGETLGIIGATGSGKTTLINLLMRFYDVGKGAIYINGIDVRSYETRKLRTMFGVAFQNDVIFNDTIYENIRFGRSISREEALEAAEYAQALPFIKEKGLDSVLAIRGANLSGGQKQRLLIARALAGKPDILILDDSSSALDYKTDARLRQEINGHFSDTTTIIIAQRISSIMGADKIIVMEEGEMIGYGTHQELIQSCPIYQEISQSQMGGEEKNE